MRAAGLQRNYGSAEVVHRMSSVFRFLLTELSGRHVSFVDCPGHDILMSTMLNGAAVMDAALLLVAGNESCPQPQTSEHLAAIEIMKLKHILILQCVSILGLMRRSRIIKNISTGTRSISSVKRKLKNTRNPSSSLWPAQWQTKLQLSQSPLNSNTTLTWSTNTSARIFQCHHVISPRRPV